MEGSDFYLIKRLDALESSCKSTIPEGPAGVVEVGVVVVGGRVVVV